MFSYGDGTVSDDSGQDILGGNVLNAHRPSPLTEDDRKELRIRTRHPLSEKLVNVWSAECAHNSLFSAKEGSEMIGGLSAFFSPRPTCCPSMASGA